MSNWADFTTGKRIKHLRGSDLTQQGLAEAAGVSLALVQKAEQDRGELSVGSLLRIAGALNTDVSVVLGQQAPRRGASGTPGPRCGGFPTRCTRVPRGLGRCGGAEHARRAVSRPQARGGHVLARRLR